MLNGIRYLPPDLSARTAYSIPVIFVCPHRIQHSSYISLLWNERSRGQVIKHYLEEKVLESDGGEVSLPFWESGCMGIYSADILALEDTGMGMSVLFHVPADFKQPSCKTAGAAHIPVFRSAERGQG